MSQVNMLEGPRFNQLFLERIQTTDGIQKVAGAMNSFIRMKVRELGLARRIINPAYVTKDDLKPRTDSDTLEFIADKEVDSEAYTASFGGTVGAHAIKGIRVAIPLWKIMSPKFRINEESLLAFSYPVTKIIEENSLKDIYKQEDLALITLAEAAVASTGNVSDHVATGLTKAKLMGLLNVMVQDENSGSPVTILMNETNWNELLTADAQVISNDLAKEILINGYPYTTAFGKRLVLTRKTSVVPVNTVYAFAGEEWLGHLLLLGDMKFFIKTEHGEIEFGIRETLGMSIINIHSCAKMFLRT